MSRPDLGVQQTPNYFLPHNRTDNFEPVTPPDSASWDSYDSKNSDSPPDYKTPLWQPVHTDISQFTDVDFPKENSVNPLKVQIAYTLLYVNTQYMFVTPTQSPKYNSLNTTAVSII